MKPGSSGERKLSEDEGHRRLMNPGQAEGERERRIESAIARIIGAKEARRLVAESPSTNEPRLTAYESSMLRRAARSRNGGASTQAGTGQQTRKEKSAKPRGRT